MGDWNGREQASSRGSGAHYLHGNLYHRDEERERERGKKKYFLSAAGRRAQFYNTEEELQHTQTPTKSLTTSH